MVTKYWFPNFFTSSSLSAWNTSIKQNFPSSSVWLPWGPALCRKEKIIAWYFPYIYQFSEELIGFVIFHRRLLSFFFAVFFRHHLDFGVKHIWYDIKPSEFIHMNAQVVSTLDSRKLFSLNPESFWQNPSNPEFPFLLFSIKRYFKLTLFISCPRPGISHFFKKSPFGENI